MVARRLVLLAALALTACGSKSDEAKIRALIADAVTAVEEGRIGDAFDHVADDYKDEDGNDKSGAKAYLTGMAFRGSRITVVRRDESVTVNEGALDATATFDAAIFQGDRAKLKGVVPQRSGTYRFTLTLEKRDGTWLVTKGAWETIPAASFLVDAL